LYTPPVTPWEWAAPEVVSLRHSESTKVAQDMRSVMIQIEMQRKKNMKTLPTFQWLTSTI